MFENVDFEKKSEDDKNHEKLQARKNAKNYTMKYVALKF